MDGKGERGGQVMLINPIKSIIVHDVQTKISGCNILELHDVVISNQVFPSHTHSLTL